MLRRLAALIAGSTLAAWPLASVTAGGVDAFAGVQHVVVIYEENHSFDNLYGGWEGVNGLAGADAAHTTQVSQAGAPFSCLLQNDVTRTSPSPRATTCNDSTTSTPFQSAFTNKPFGIDNYIAPTDTTCPAPGAF